MSNIPAEIIMQGNDNAWFATNAAIVYPANIQIFHIDGRYKFTDGVKDVATLPFLGSGSSSSTTGLVQIYDPSATFFSDLATANAWLRGYYPAAFGNTLIDESFSEGVYSFTPKVGAIFFSGSYFLANSNAIIVDEFGLIASITSGLSFENNTGIGSKLPNAQFFDFDFNAFSGTIEVNKLDLSIVFGNFAENSTGKFIINGDIGSSETAQFGAGFFLNSTATIHVKASKYTSNAGGIQGDLAQAIANGANVFFDGIDKEPSILPGTVGQYWRGDKTWQPLLAGGLYEERNVFATGTVYTILAPTYNTAKISQVFVDGILQIPTTNYTITNITTLTFAVSLTGKKLQIFYGTNGLFIPTPPAMYIEASGGLVSRDPLDSDYLIHKIYAGSDSGFQVFSNLGGYTLNGEIAGGGGAGGGTNNGGAGGGAASQLKTFSFVPSVRSYATSVGIGGLKGLVFGGIGGTSSIETIGSTVTCLGGIGGADGAGGTNGDAPSGYYLGAGMGYNRPTLTSIGSLYNGGSYVSGGGGGGGAGMGAKGGNCTTANGGNGGNGILSSITNQIVCAGGGGGGFKTLTGGVGGSSSVGGNGGAGLGSSVLATSGTINTGSGGGGAGGNGTAQGGDGGSGFIYIRYYHPTPYNFTQYQLNTILSNTAI